MRLEKTAGAPPPAKVLVSYEPAESRRAERGLIKLKEWNYLESVADGIAESVRLPRDLKLVGASCGMANAYYLSDQDAIVICYELIDHVIAKAARAKIGETRKTLPPDERNLLAFGAVTFIALHEVGHALVHMLDLPITGREEDVADQIATFLTLREINDPEVAEVAPWVVLGGMWFFDTDQRRRDITPYLAGEHALDGQRRVNIGCWSYGSDPKAFAALARVFTGASDRLLRCPDEYAKMDRALRQLFGSHLIQ
jgi:Putative metallopeptidase